METDQGAGTLGEDIDFFLANLLSRLGEPDYGRRLIDETLSHAIPAEKLGDIAHLSFALGDHEKGFEYLEKAIDGKSSVMAMTIRNPFMDAVKNDPRYRVALDRTGLLTVMID